MRVDMEGILNLNKPSGPTSLRMVCLVRRLTGVKKVGHAGTLDPLACGVLPICLGRATKLIPLLHQFTKTYRAVIQLGVVTDTYDAEGKIIRQKDPSYVDLDLIERNLSFFKGEIEQQPPPYSAVKLGGRPLYFFARRGIKVNPPPRKVHIYQLKVVDFSPPFLTLEMEVSGGTYVRSLAYELGERLGCGACVREAIRLRYGIFSIEDAITPERFEKSCQEGSAHLLIMPINRLLTFFSPSQKFRKV